MITLEQVANHGGTRVFLKQADANLGAIGYTEHGERHADLVARRARYIMQSLGYPPETCELAAIAGYIHDIGNAINRKTHGQASAFIAYHILSDLGMEQEKIAEVMGAVANHDEVEGDPVSPVACAVIIADKSDVHRSRVRTLKEIDFDIHDRVNYAVKSSALVVDSTKRTITLQLEIDTEISKVMEYFEIFLTRMLCCQRAAKVLNAEFKLVMNNTKIL